MTKTVKIAKLQISETMHNYLSVTNQYIQYSVAGVSRGKAHIRAKHIQIHYHIHFISHCAIVCNRVHGNRQLSLDSVFSNILGFWILDWFLCKCAEVSIHDFLKMWSPATNILSHYLHPRRSHAVLYIVHWILHITMYASMNTWRVCTRVSLRAEFYGHSFAYKSNKKRTIFSIHRMA